MRLGVIASPAAGFSYEEIRDLARAAEASGFSSFWVSDHFFGGTGGAPGRNCLEAGALLPAPSRDTPRVPLRGPLGARPQPEPALQAEKAARVGPLSGGR